MQAFSLVCVLCIFPVMFCFRFEIEADVLKHIENDDVLHIQADVTNELEPYIQAVTFDDEVDEMNADNCMCCQHGCDCETVDPRNNIPIRVSLMLSDADEHRQPQLSAVMRVGSVEVIDREVPFKSRKEICGEKNGKTYCFKVIAALKKKNGKSFIKGLVEMTKPEKIFIGKFKMPE